MNTPVTPFNQPEKQPFLLVYNHILRTQDRVYAQIQCFATHSP